MKEIIARHNDYNLVMGIVARVIRASADGDRNSILVEPDVHFLNLAKKLIFFISSSHTDLWLKPIEKITGRLKLLLVEAVLQHGL